MDFKLGIQFPRKFVFILRLGQVHPDTGKISEVQQFENVRYKYSVCAADHIYFVLLPARSPLKPFILVVGPYCLQFEHVLNMSFNEIILDSTVHIVIRFRVLNLSIYQYTQKLVYVTGCEFYFKTTSAGGYCHYHQLLFL